MQATKKIKLEPHGSNPHTKIMEWLIKEVTRLREYIITKNFAVLPPDVLSIGFYRLFENEHLSINFRGNRLIVGLSDWFTTDLIVSGYFDKKVFFEKVECKEDYYIPCEDCNFLFDDELFESKFEDQIKLQSDGVRRFEDVVVKDCVVMKLH